MTATVSPRHLKPRPGMSAKIGPGLVSRGSLVVTGVAVGGAVVTGGVALSAPAMAAPGTSNVVVLKYGSQGALVKVAQQRLRISVDGSFGPDTRRAVTTFQGRQGLARDGFVGPRTWAKLGGFPGGVSGGGTTSAPAPVRTPTCSVKVVRYGASGSLVVALQQNLRVTADGNFGPQTPAAVKKFQVRKGITADGRGVAGPATWRALGGMPCGPGSAAAPSGTSSGSGSSSGTPVSVSGSTTGKLSRVIGVAKQHLGVPYVYGGSTPRGFDCSGLTQYSYSHAGLRLPRTARAQQAYMNRTSSPVPGDLVFFGYPAHHVGIYLGNGQMLAAPYPGQRVRIQNYVNPTGFGTLR